MSPVSFLLKHGNATHVVFRNSTIIFVIAIIMHDKKMKWILKECYYYHQTTNTPVQWPNICDSLFEIKVGVGTAAAKRRTFACWQTNKTLWVEIWSSGSVCGVSTSDSCPIIQYKGSSLAYRDPHYKDNELILKWGHVEASLYWCGPLATSVFPLHNETLVLDRTEATPTKQFRMNNTRQYLHHCIHPHTLWSEFC